VTQDFSPPAGTLAAGAQIAGYQIGEQIGTGGMAVVYRALDLRLGRHVALKVLAPRLAEDDAFRQRFIRESRAAAGVDHPHIIPVFEAGETDGVLFIAMRYVSAGDVRTLIQAEGTLPPARASAIASQAASALDAAHAHGLVHRDVKPGNILLDSVGGRDHVYLADFGLSKHSLAATTLTAAGQFMGTLDYVSPEQIQGHPADGRADQYALACTVVEMLAGTPPYKRDESMALLWAQLEAPPPLVTELRPDLPPELNRVMSTALAKSPKDRYPTCAAFAAAVAVACEAKPVVLREPTALAAALAEEAATPPAGSPGRSGQTRPEPVLAGQPALEETAAAPPRQPAAFTPAREPAGAGPGPGSPPPLTGRDPGAPAPARPGPRQPAGDRQPAGWQQPPGGTWAAREPHLVPQRPPAPSHAGRRTFAAILGLVIIAGLGFAGFKLLNRTHKTAGSLPPVYKTVTVTPSPAAAATVSPADTVQAYFAALNARKYRRAWQLNTVVHSNETYQQFVTGQSVTESNNLTVQSTAGNVVAFQLVATQTDGTVKTFQGTDTVTNGIITASAVRQTSG
jgi:Protein kinase domain